MSFCALKEGLGKLSEVHTCSTNCRPKKTSQRWKQLNTKEQIPSLTAPGGCETKAHLVSLKKGKERSKYRVKLNIRVYVNPWTIVISIQLGYTSGHHSREAGLGSCHRHGEDSRSCCGSDDRPVCPQGHSVTLKESVGEGRPSAASSLITS